MPTRLSRTAMIAGLAGAVCLALGTLPLAAQAPGLTGQASPGMPGEPRPALLTARPLNQVLPADSAFALSARLQDDASRVQLHWDIAPGYYLYRKSLKLGDDAETPLELPPGASIKDEYFGIVEVYYDSLDLEAATGELGVTDGNLLLVVEYQGCAAERYCYPPQRKELLLSLP